MQRFSSISLALFVIFTIVGITPSPLFADNWPQIKNEIFFLIT